MGLNFYITDKETQIMVLNFRVLKVLTWKYRTKQRELVSYFNQYNQIS